MCLASKCKVYGPLSRNLKSSDNLNMQVPLQGRAYIEFGDEQSVQRAPEYSQRHGCGIWVSESTVGFWDCEGSQ